MRKERGEGATGREGEERGRYRKGGSEGEGRGRYRKGGRGERELQEGMIEEDIYHTARAE